MGPVRRSTVLALALTVVVAAGCGSSSSSSGLNKQQLASKANAICTSFKPKLAAVHAPADILSNQASAAQYFDQIAPLYDQAIGELKKLQPASSVKGQWNQMLARFEAVGSLVDQVRIKADKRAGGEIPLLSQIVPRTNAADAAASQIGATACASTSTQSGGG